MHEDEKFGNDLFGARLSRLMMTKRLDSMFILVSRDGLGNH